MNNSLSAHCSHCSNQFFRYKAAIRVAAHLAKRPAHYLWAVLIARIYEVFPLLWLIRFRLSCGVTSRG